MSSAVPTAKICSPFDASASALGRDGSCVRIVPPEIMRSAKSLELFCRCCAVAESGQSAAEPPNPVMTSRRLMSTSFRRNALHAPLHDQSTQRCRLERLVEQMHAFGLGLVAHMRGTV